jgi:preprotein translocase subunit SecF
MQMNIETVFITQIASIIGFTVVLFVLYRVLVSQKDATIELLKEKNSHLQEQLIAAREVTPDKLAKKLSERIHVLLEELERLSKDQEKNKLTIQQKEKELQDTQKNLEQLKEQLEEAQEIASEYFCPYCKAPMSVRDYYTETYEWGDAEHEFISFECGLTLVDGKENHPCKHKMQA